jgi:hypothetical protein
MPTTDYTPTAAELAVFMKTRTKTRFGAVVGEFTADTPVTLDEATDLIDQAVNETALAVGSDLPDGPADDVDLYRKGAQQVVLLLAAMNVELAISGEQVNDPRSPYAALERRVNSLRKTLIEAVSEMRGAYGGGGESDAADNLGESLHPSYHFPQSADTGTRRW